MYYKIVRESDLLDISQEKDEIFFDNLPISLGAYGLYQYLSSNCDEIDVNDKSISSFITEKENIDVVKDYFDELIKKGYLKIVETKP